MAPVALTDDLLAEWDLRVDGAPMRGRTAVVTPVLTADDVPAVLKVSTRSLVPRGLLNHQVVVPHPEAEHEHLALKRWAGDGAVELLRADPGRWALLLERLEYRDLREEWDVAACEVVGDLYRRLHVPALPQLRTLSSSVARWAEELARAEVAMPPRLVQQAMSIARDLAGDPATDGTLIHTDLHYENVLAAEREPWLAIDPKPMSGDPHYEVAPLLWNRFDELAGDVRRGTRARFHAVVDAAGLDEDRARDWVVLRMVVAADDLDPTRCVAIAKAVQD
ncbi:aminoglycoside phosphotransferase family protein [Nocardioides mangrovicus]